MAEKTEKKPSSIQRLFEFAGNYKYLAVASWILAAISAFAVSYTHLTLPTKLEV